jgi:PAS domain S-box-containing protein
MTFSEQSGVFGLFVADHVDAMLAYWDKDMVCRFVNKAYTDWFGKTREELVGKYTIPQLLGPLYNNRKSFIDAVLAGESQKFEGEQINAKGEIGNLLISYHPDVENGTVKGFFVHCVNISSAKSLETTSQMYASIVNSTSDGIISKRTDGTIVTWNKGAERILGYSAAEAEGKNISLIFPPYLQHEEQQLVARVQSGAPVEQYETLRQHKDGRLVNVSITLSPVRDSMDNITAITNVMRDITLHKLAEEEARRSNERNRIFVQQAPNALAMVDKDMRYLAASARWMKDYGLGEKDIIGKSHYEVFPEIGEDWKQIHRDCLAGATNQCDEAPFERADGTVQWLQWDVRPWYQTENEIGGLLMYTADITHIKDKENERKRIQHILEKTNQVARIAHW